MGRGMITAPAEYIHHVQIQEKKNMYSWCNMHLVRTWYIPGIRYGPCQMSYRTKGGGKEY